MVRLTREAIDVPSLSKASSPKDGAVCTFVGVVRGSNGGRAVRSLEYESYEEMALAEMASLEADVKGRFGLSELAIVHRLGSLEIGEASVLIVAASPHRAEAFEACRHTIDTLKKTVPIWKKEFYEDGSVWIEGPGAPTSSLSSAR